MKDTLHEAALLTAEAIRSLREENLQHLTTLGELERALDRAEVARDLEHQRANDAERRADFYMRYCVEITTFLASIRSVAHDHTRALTSLIDEACERSQDQAFKPSLAPTKEIAKQTEELPAALQEFLVREPVR